MAATLGNQEFLDTLMNFYSQTREKGSVWITIKRGAYALARIVLFYLIIPLFKYHLITKEDRTLAKFELKLIENFIQAAFVQ